MAATDLRSLMRPHLCVVMSFTVIANLACGESSRSPTAPTPAGPQFLIDFSAVTFTTEEQEAVRRTISDVWSRSSTTIPLPMVTFLVLEDAGRVIPGWGVGGYTVSPSDVELVFDRQADGIVELARDRLPIVVAHETHHTARILTTGYPMTLLETLVFEGMADAYAVELLGHAPPPWAVALNESQLDRWRAVAVPLFDDSTFSFEAWFFGFGEQPRWTGYTLGYDLIRRFLEANPARSAASLIRESADSFR